MIAGDRGSTGKTTVALGLCAALHERGHRVQPFKKGPDFIDPMWLSQASGGRPCRNLDRFLMGERLPRIFYQSAQGADVSLIEGNRGLFDSMDTEGKGSTAALARLLGAPILLVVDSSKMTRGIAPLLQGYMNFEKDLDIAGVVLNNVAAERHERKLRAAVERYTDVKLLGVVRRSAELEIDERHLGLIPAEELESSRPLIEKIARVIGESVDLDGALQIARGAPDLRVASDEDAEETIARGGKGARIAVAKDRAFGFYYPENLEALERAGARLTFFSPLADKALPEADGLYFGGGFPESFLGELERNTAMRVAVRRACEDGAPVYAECGGLMYLSQGITWGPRSGEMAGVLPVAVRLDQHPQGRGYMILKTRAREGGLWRLPGAREFRAHEFHYSRLAEPPGEEERVFDVLRGHGLDGKTDGLLLGNVLASYAHLNAYSAPWWAPAFVDAAARYARVREKTRDEGHRVSLH